VTKHFHFLKTARRIRQCLVRQIQTADSTHVTTQEILRTFKRYYIENYEAIPITNESKDKILIYVGKKFPGAANAAFETEITKGELYYATQQSLKNKAPGPDGISPEFIQTFWDDFK
jgi:predicted secreted Zn-dependent protease